jgi:hypothetical protein
MSIYEINISIKDGKNKEVGRRFFETDSAGELAVWYERNKNVLINADGEEVKAQKKRRRKKKEK